MVNSKSSKFDRPIWSEDTTVGNPSSRPMFPYQFGVGRRPDGGDCRELRVTIFGSVELQFRCCVLVGSSSNADVDSRRWCISAYPAVVSDHLLVYERMGKAAMLKALEEAEVGSSGAVVPPTKVAKKRRASTLAEKEARRQKKKKGASTSGARPAPTIEEEGTDEGNRPERVPALNVLEDSLVVSQSGTVITRFLCQIAPDLDIGRLGGASDSEAVGLFAANFASAMARRGKVIKRLTRTHRARNGTHQSFDEAIGHHSELVTKLEELEALRAQEKGAAEAKKEALEAQLSAEKAARAVVEEAFTTERMALEEVGHLRSKAATAWVLGKEEFLKSSEFDDLCTKKSLAYFTLGFEGCVAQFRANGYSEEEHPASFLDVKKALHEMSDDEDEEGDEEDEDDADITPPSPPKK
ncbi:hypothetical protein F511_16886 [Dorcoceras hygrometricum]|uniref:Uncharacterized protein n=1 Tax=Dorcoceras hygrometricum TaxID=472368 RepID=A0A2Z7DAZ3_9LAMI|nr:hypothetical protein F511_16886 [Dorcoceras hygrometricum]